jgi:Transmembrane protein 18
LLATARRSTISAGERPPCEDTVSSGAAPPCGVRACVRARALGTAMPAAELGPLELLYNGADSVLAAAQAVLPARVVGDFIDSVRWGEPFILGLCAAQVAMLWAVAAFRRRPAVQAGLLIVCATVAFAGRWLNGIGSRRWPAFATQDYFDSAGMFMLIFVSGPLIVCANVIVVSLV